MAQDPLHVLWVEPHFPGRLGAVADWLVRRRGYRCSFYCHTARAARALAGVGRPGAGGPGLRRRRRRREPAVTWSRTLERSLCYSYGCWEVLEQNAAPADRPDRRPLGRAGLDAFRPGLLRRPRPWSTSSITTIHAHQQRPGRRGRPPRPRRPTSTGGGRWPRSSSSTWSRAPWRWTPTDWQRELFPAEYRDDFRVLHDGVDTRRFGSIVAARDRRTGPRRSPAGRSCPTGRASSASWPGRSTASAGSTGSWHAGRCLAARPRRCALRRRGRPDRPARAGCRVPQPGLPRASAGAAAAGRSRAALVPGAVDAGRRGRGPGRQRPARGARPALSGGPIAARGDGRRLRRAGLRHRAAPRGHQPRPDRASGRRRDPERSGAQALAVLDDPAAHRPLGDAAAELVRERYAPGRLPARLAERFSTLAAARKEVAAMNVLFIHDAFPAQFGRLGLELTRRHGWRCSFLVQSLSSCPTPTPEMLQDARAAPDAPDGRASVERRHSLAPDLRALPRAVPDGLRRDRGQAAAPPRPGRRPRRPRRADACSSATCSTARSSSIANIISRPAIATSRTGSTCRRPSPPRSSRAASTRRRWRPWSTATPATRRRTGRSSRFPARFHSKIEVHFDGIDTELYRPGPAPRRIGEVSIPAGHAGRHLRRSRAGVDPRVRPVHEGRRADRPRACRRALRRGRRRGDPLRLGQAPHRLAELQAMGPEPGRATTCRGSSSRAGSCPSNWPTSSGSATCTST